jgi:hypothetical protein
MPCSEAGRLRFSVFALGSGTGCEGNRRGLAEVVRGSSRALPRPRPVTRSDRCTNPASLRETGLVPSIDVGGRERADGNDRRPGTSGVVCTARGRLMAAPRSSVPRPGAACRDRGEQARLQSGSLVKSYSGRTSRRMNATCRFARRSCPGSDRGELAHAPPGSALRETSLVGQEIEVRPSARRVSAMTEVPARTACGQSIASHEVAAMEVGGPCRDSSAPVQRIECAPTPASQWNNSRGRCPLRVHEAETCLTRIPPSCG